MTWSVQKKIFLLIICTLLIPSFFFIGILSYQSCKSIITMQLTYCDNTTKKSAERLNYAIETINNSAYYLLSSDNIFQFFQSSHYDSSNSIRYNPLESQALNTLVYLVNNGDFIDGVHLYGANGTNLVVGSVPFCELSEPDKQQAMQLSGKAFWGEVTLPYQKAEKDYFYQCRLLRNPKNLREIAGIVRLYITKEKIGSFFDNADTTSWYVTDHDGNAFYTLAAEDSFSFSKIEKSSQPRAYVTWQNYTPYIVVSQPISAVDWNVYSVYAPEEILIQLKTSLLSILWIVLFCLLVCFIAAYYLSRKITLPITNAIESIKEFQNENFSARIHYESNDELSLLTDQFNKMAAHIQTLIEENYHTTIRRQAAELKALQMQINPHFLYNTLNVIYWQAKSENAVHSADVLMELSNVFRSIVKNATEFSTVETELEHLKSYVSLLLLTQNEFSCELHIDDELLDCQTARLVLQPLVENVVLHGFAARDDGHIDICIYRSDDTLVFKIIDNGAGANVELLNRLIENDSENETKCIGIRNVNERIQLSYGPQYGLHFSDTPGGGCTTTVTQPFLKYEDKSHDNFNDCGR